MVGPRRKPQRNQFDRKITCSAAIVCTICMRQIDSLNFVLSLQLLLCFVEKKMSKITQIYERVIVRFVFQGGLFAGGQAEFGGAA
jgi:hypothetical protein